MIKTKNLKQAKQLVRLTGLPTGATIEISEHPRLNSSKGVIRTNLLRSVKDDDFLAEMKEQNIVAIQRIKKKVNNKEVETGTYFLTFSTCETPKSIRMCYELLEVREFTPNSMRCWNCLSFNHTKKFCTGKKLCSNCGLDYHLIDDSEKCDQPAKCVNCSGDHPSLDRECPAYLMNKEINAIMVQNKLSIRKARALYNLRNPAISYARIVSQNSQ
jgi:hypothetical protein